MKLKANVAVIDIIGHLLIWFLLTVVTLGIALLFFPYSFAKFIINRACLVDDLGRERKMVCDIDMFSDLGHVILWFVISVLTLGVGYFFYVYRVWNYALNNTRVE